MNDKKYQVFISSTFKDLVVERQAVIRTVLNLQHIPAGMELFPAADDEQFLYIKKVIDQCDYYVLILGGRYGSTDADGVGYTEREFDYAVESKKYIIALVHGAPEDIPRKNTEEDPVFFAKFTAFRTKVITGRLVKFWTNATELELAAFQSLSLAFQSSPAIGWIRGNQAASDTVLQQLNDARNRIEELTRTIDDLSGLDIETKEMADLTQTVPMRFRYRLRERTVEKTVELSFEQMLIAIGPTFLEFYPANAFDGPLDRYLRDNMYLEGDRHHFVRSDVEKVEIHFLALGLMETVRNSQGITCYKLTSRGVRELATRGATKKVTT